MWNEYLENSLKATTRGKRGSGVRQRVAADKKLDGIRTSRPEKAGIIQVSH